MATEAIVYLNWGRWVANCPRPYCGNAEQHGRCPDGSVGGLTDRGFTCRVEYGGCGLQCAAVWPPNQTDIEKVVGRRPVPSTRNWMPGESIHLLTAENIAYGGGL